MTAPTEQRSTHFSRTNTTNFRRLLRISPTWFIYVDQPSHFSISWEYTPCCTSSEQQSQCSHHLAFWQKWSVTQEPFSSSSGFGRQATPSDAGLTAACTSCSWWTRSCATRNYQLRLCPLATAQNCSHLLLLTVSRLPPRRGWKECCWPGPCRELHLPLSMAILKRRVW